MQGGKLRNCRRILPSLEQQSIIGRDLPPHHTFLPHPRNMWKWLTAGQSGNEIWAQLSADLTCARMVACVGEGAVGLGGITWVGWHAPLFGLLQLLQ